MNLSAIRDLVETILTEWYARVAGWTPPGELGAVTCRSCGDSLLAQIMAVGSWPHELEHALAEGLDAAVAEIAFSRAEAAGEVEVDYHQRVARALVLADVSADVDDILDVLAQCVTPRLDAHVGAEAARGLRDLERFSSAR